MMCRTGLTHLTISLEAASEETAATKIKAAVDGKLKLYMCRKVMMLFRAMTDNNALMIIPWTDIWLWI